MINSIFVSQPTLPWPMIDRTSSLLMVTVIRVWSNSMPMGNIFKNIPWDTETNNFSFPIVWFSSRHSISFAWLIEKMAGQIPFDRLAWRTKGFVDEFRIVCFNTGPGDEGQVKAIITDPAMTTVYALTVDANKRSFLFLLKERQLSKKVCLDWNLDRLYAVSGGSGKGRPLGFTFSIHPQSFGQLISTWKPNDVCLFTSDFSCAEFFLFIELRWTAWLSLERQRTSFICWRNSSQSYSFIRCHQLISLGLLVNSLCCLSSINIPQHKQ